MAGGKFDGSRRRYAPRLATGLLGGLFIAPCGAALVSAGATAPPAAEDCADRPDEKSIVVESAKVPDLADDVVVASDNSRDSLEPIPNVSECEPELAEKDGPQKPELAEATDQATVEKAGVAPKSSGTTDRPAADDVCVEESTATIAGEVSTAPRVETASFNGVMPGGTTRAEVLEKWGQPASGGATDTITYKLDRFPSIQISFADDTVDSIRIQLGEPASASSLIAKLGLAELRPARLQTESGAVAATKFPERGVELVHVVGTAVDSAAANDSTESAVSEIIVRPVSAEGFVERAESCPAREYGHCIADLETALEMDGASARAKAMLSQVKLAIGEAAAAEKLAAEAVQLEPRSDDIRLQWAKCLKYQAKYDQAVEQTRMVLEGTTASQLVRAQALEQMALLAALGDKEVQERAIPLHNKAIELADKLAESEDAAVRVAAKQLLVGAHLAIAERVAVGDWQNKSKSVEQWLSRASSIAEEMIAAGEADVSLRLQVALTGLGAGGRLNPPVDPTPWVAEAEQAAADLEATASDPLAVEELHWQLGMAYLYATEIEHRRGQAESALKYGDLARARMAPLTEGRRELPDAEFALGRLYFQIGAVYAVHHQDHDLACQWYDRAVETLMKPVPLTPLAGPAHHGDALVSMGVSYWEIGARDRAYELTKSGLELVQQGVEEGLLAEQSLDVPRSNLAAMSRALGKSSTTPVESSGDTRFAKSPSTGQRNGTAQRQRQMNVADGRARSDASGTRRR